MKKDQNGFGPMAVLIAIFMMSAIGVAGWQVYKKRSENKSTQVSYQANQSGSALKVGSSNDVSQAEIRHITNPDTKQLVAIYPNIYYVLKTDTGQTYYGNAQKINDEYAKLYNVSYFKDANTIVALGDELHGPESIMYINMKHVSAFAQLNPGNTNYGTVTNFYKTASFRPANDVYPSSLIQGYLKRSQIQAFFFADGKIYYAKVSNFNDGFLAGSTVYTLRSSATNEIRIVKVEQAEVSKYIPQDILFWENLRSDGQISRAITELERR